MKTQNKHKVKRTFGDWLILSLDLGIYFFFFMFLMIYIGRYGLTEFILQGESKHIILLNICMWFTLTMYNMDKFFEGIKKHFGGKHK